MMKRMTVTGTDGSATEMGRTGESAIPPIAFSGDMEVSFRYIITIRANQAQGYVLNIKRILARKKLSVKCVCVFEKTQKVRTC